MKKALLSVLIAAFFLVAGTSVAQAATRTYRFHYFMDTDSSNSLTIGDVCLRSVSLRYGAQMPAPVNWIYSNLTISGTPYDFMENAAEIASCKQTSTSNISLAVGRLHRIFDLEGHGSSEYFTPTSGSGTVYYGLRYNDGNM